jgi:ectoine hydroxylase-related dioxygenase (phytanoyl-CoA dioxygenase family)
MSEFTVTDREAMNFWKQGFFIRERVFDESDLRRLKAAVEDVHEDMLKRSRDKVASPVQYVDDKRYQEILSSSVKWEWRDGATDIRSMEPFLYLHPDLENIVDDARIAEPARSVLGTEKISLFTDKLNFKRPEGAPFPWHQDSPYFVFDCKHVDRLVSMQIYLDDANTDNGCLWIIPRSHIRGILPGVQDKGVLDRLYTDMDAFEGEEPMPVVLPAGSVLFFHAHIIHGSKTNHAQDSRRAIILTYQPDTHPMWKSQGSRPIQIPQP